MPASLANEAHTVLYDTVQYCIYSNLCTEQYYLFLHAIFNGGIDLLHDVSYGGMLRNIEVAMNAQCFIQ